MEKIKQHLDRAYSYLSKIPVTGEAVDLMAIVRQELRTAYQEAAIADEAAKHAENGEDFSSPKEGSDG